MPASAPLGLHFLGRAFDFGSDESSLACLSGSHRTGHFEQRLIRLHGCLGLLCELFPIIIKVNPIIRSRWGVDGE